MGEFTTFLRHKSYFNGFTKMKLIHIIFCKIINVEFFILVI